MSDIRTAEPAAAQAATAAVLLATAGDPAALQPWGGTTILGRLRDQLRDVGVEEVLVITRPQWKAAFDDPVHVSTGPEDDLRAIAAFARHSALLVAHADLVLHGSVLAGLLADPRPGTVALVGEPRPFAPRVRERQGRIVSAASPYHAVHDPDHAFLGVLKVAAADRAALATVAERLGALLAAGPSPDWRAQHERRERIWRRALLRTERRAAKRRRRALPKPRPPLPKELSEEGEAQIRHQLAASREDVASLLLTGLVREGHGVGPRELRELFWARPLSREEAAEAARGIEEHDEERALLDSAVKANDGFFTTFFVSPYSKYLARWAARRGLTPNQVTTASMLIGLVAAAAFATGERWGLVAGAVLLQFSFTTDCVDGQLARYTRTFSQLGAWLDSVFDRAKEYVVFAGLAIGASQAGDDVWLLAGAALTLQTVRHMLDFSFGDTQRQKFASAVRPPLEQPSDRPGGQVDEDDDDEDDGPGRMPFRRRALGGWRQLERSPAFLWPRKMIVFPIGERFAAISLTAALFTPRVTFIVLLAWGGLAAAYALTGRLLRSVNRTTHRGPQSASPDRERGPA